LLPYTTLFRSSQRSFDHTIDFVRDLLNFFDGGAEAVLGKIDDVSYEKNLVVAFIHGDNVFRHSKKSGIHSAGLQSGQPVSPQRDDVHLAAGLKMEMLEPQV